LTVDAPQVAVAKENIAGSVCADKRRLFAKVSCVRRDDWEASRIASRDFVLQTVVEAIAWADGATFEKGFESRHTVVQFTCG